MEPLPSGLARGELFSSLDVHFARFLSHIAGNAEPCFWLSAALVSHASGQGHVCLDLKRWQGQVITAEQTGAAALQCPARAEWRELLLNSGVVGAPGEFKPLILDEGDRLYLQRYWAYEQALAADILERSRAEAPVGDEIRLRASLQRLFTAPDGIVGPDWQQVAAAAAALKRFCVISGGPGTGKTTTVAKILAMLIEQRPQQPPKIVLTAPTGKAAARLSSAIQSLKSTLPCGDTTKQAMPHEAQTLHRLLKTIPGSPDFRHDALTPLATDAVVVDEASMVDLPLMTKLFQAVPKQARIVLLGDKDQLASVEAGAVLGDICAPEGLSGFSAPINRKIQQLTSRTLVSRNAQPAKAGLGDCIIQLEHSYRFDADSAIGRLSQAIKQGDAEAALKLLQTPPDTTLRWHPFTGPGTLQRLLPQYIRNGYAAFTRSNTPYQALATLNRFMVLCAVKGGATGIGAMNRLAETVLAKAGSLKPQGAWYTMRPLLITRNNYQLGLYNGDIGVIMPYGPGTNDTPYAFFPSADGRPRALLPQRLPAHETVFALTIHKSQGSEFEQILLILPEFDSPVLTRELLYTAITRARRSVILIASEVTLKTTIQRCIERSSGLRQALWGGLESS